MSVHNLEEVAKWQRKLLRTKEGAIKHIQANVVTALRESLAWRGVVAYNDFNSTIMMVKPPPWERRNTNWQPEQWADHHDTAAANWMQHQGITVGPRTVGNAIALVARDQTYNPVQDYLNGLEWDGQPRVDLLASYYFSCEDSEYTRAVSRCFLISAVARIMEPGCQADNMPVLEGPQGTYKSTALRVLFGDEWFSDDFQSIRTKDGAMLIGKKWCIEVAELGAMLRSDVEFVKSVITRRVDEYRPPYGRQHRHKPRHTVLVGTTNRDTYMRDETGGRRFWPLQCGVIKRDALERDRDQMWAEAVHLYRQGEKWWIEGPLLNTVIEEQDSRYNVDNWEPVINKWLEDKDDVSIPEILSLVLNLDIERRGQTEQNRVAAILRRLGWDRYRKRYSATRLEWRYRRSQ